MESLAGAFIESLKDDFAVRFNPFMLPIFPDHPSDNDTEDCAAFGAHFPPHSVVQFPVFQTACLYLFLSLS